MSKSFRDAWLEKTTVHLTYDRKGDFVGSYVDDDATKGIMPNLQISKPGPSIHSEKWDRCVADVKQQGNADPYAVCTAKLGEEAFKSEFRPLAYVKSLITKARKEVAKMGIGDAGVVPNSLLARQDLEDADKSVVDDASLYDLKDDAKDAVTEEEKDEVADKIKEVQVKRQKATMNQRKEKSFKNAWASLFHKASSEGSYELSNSNSDDGISPDEAEQNWVRLKRERKELENAIDSLSKRKETVSTEVETIDTKLAEAQAKLEAINAEISENLDYLKNKG